MLVLPAELTHDQAATCCRMLEQGLPAQSGPSVVVDAGSLSHFDSSALAVLLECRRNAMALGKTFAVARLPTRLRDLAALYGVDDLLPAAA